jgi:hypothetical protein
VELETGSNGVLRVQEVPELKLHSGNFISRAAHKMLLLISGLGMQHIYGSGKIA